MKGIIASKFKPIFCVTAVSAMSITASALTTNQPACAQTDSSCIDRLMYVTARANSGPTPDRGEWRFSRTYGSTDGSVMRAAACRAVGFLGSDGWRCPNEVMTFQVMSASEAVARCNGYVPPANDGQNANSGSSNPNNQVGSTILNQNGFVPSNHEIIYAFNITNRTQSVRVQVGGYNGFDPILRVEDSFGNILSENDDYGSGLNSQLVFNLAPGRYRAIVGGFGGASGNYNIVINSN
jgi:hypothetical protein